MEMINREQVGNSLVFLAKQAIWEYTHWVGTQRSSERFTLLNTLLGWAENSINADDEQPLLTNYQKRSRYAVCFLIAEYYTIIGSVNGERATVGEFKTWLGA